MRLLLNLFKLRIGVAIALAAVAGIAVTPGALRSWQAVVLTLAVLVSASAAGAFNQYVERDLDARMARTRNRPFVSGALKHGPLWLWVIGAMTAASVLAAAFAANWLAAFYVFMGAFTYGVVYTVWLKRRTWLNIVVGGLAGSFAVLAGLTDAQLEEFLDRLVVTCLTMHSITDIDVLRSEVHAVRSQGYALIDQELEEGIRSVAAPLRDRHR